MNSSYDPRMEQYPLLISYPRSGSNWLNCTLELYYNKPRLRGDGPVTFLKNRRKRTDYMWFHDHDIFSDLKVGHDNILYLYRNPDDVIYSLLMAENGHTTQKLVDDQIFRLKKHFRKYILNGVATECVRYESLKNMKYKEFDKIIKFFNKIDVLNKGKLNSAIKIVKKGQIINKEVDKRYFNKNMLSSSYEVGRKKFKDQYSSYIYANLITKELSDYFV